MPPTSRSLRIPAQQTPGAQPAQQRPARALPYRIAADLRPGEGSIFIDFANPGTKAAVFSVHDYAPYAQGPWRYTLDGGQSHAAGQWNDLPRDSYDLAIHGPNGFYRHFTGRLRHDDQPVPDLVKVTVGEEAGQLLLSVQNDGDAPADITLAFAAAYVRGDVLPTKRTVTVAPRARQTVRLDVAAADHWFDFSLTQATVPGWSQRFAGHVENRHRQPHRPRYRRDGRLTCERVGDRQRFQ